MSHSSEKHRAPRFRHTRRNHTIAAIFAAAIPFSMLDMAAIGLIAGSMMWGISTRANPSHPMKSRALAACLVILVGVAPTLLSSQLGQTAKSTPVIGPTVSLIMPSLVAALAMYLLGVFWTNRANARNRVRRTHAPRDKSPS